MQKLLDTILLATIGLPVVAGLAMFATWAMYQIVLAGILCIVG